MGMTCTICERPDRNQIDAAIISGKSLRGIMRQTGADHDAVARHRGCITQLIARAHEREGKKLVARIERMVGHVERLVEDAAAINHGGQILAAVRELRPSLELLGRATGEIQDRASLMLFLELGVRDQSEIRSALDLARSGERMNLDDMQGAGVELLLDVLGREPQRRLSVLEALAGGAASSHNGGNGLLKAENGGPDGS